jgi:hypothetical protein
MTVYDYDRQCYSKQDTDGTCTVLACGHGKPVPGCYACNHAGEQYRMDDKNAD